MIRFAWVGLTLAVLSAPVLAQDQGGGQTPRQTPSGAPLSGAEFDAYVTGRTLMFGTAGDEPYGGEDYLPGNRVRWSFLDGRCLEGRWYEEGSSICFVYTDSPVPICWTFYAAPGGLMATLDSDPASALYETGETDETLFCLGPEVGV